MKIRFWSCARDFYHSSRISFIVSSSTNKKKHTKTKKKKKKKRTYMRWPYASIFQWYTRIFIYNQFVNVFVAILYVRVIEAMNKKKWLIIVNVYACAYIYIYVSFNTLTNSTFNFILQTLTNTHTHTYITHINCVLCIFAWQINHHRTYNSRSKTFYNI